MIQESTFVLPNIAGVFLPFSDKELLYDSVFAGLSCLLMFLLCGTVISGTGLLVTLRICLFSRYSSPASRTISPEKC